MSITTNRIKNLISNYFLRERVKLADSQLQHLRGFYDDVLRLSDDVGLSGEDIINLSRIELSLGMESTARSRLNSLTKCYLRKKRMWSEEDIRNCLFLASSEKLSVQDRSVLLSVSLDGIMNDYILNPVVNSVIDDDEAGIVKTDYKFMDAVNLYYTKAALSILSLNYQSNDAARQLLSMILDDNKISVDNIRKKILASQEEYEEYSEKFQTALTDFLAGLDVIIDEIDKRILALFAPCIAIVNGEPDRANKILEEAVAAARERKDDNALISLAYSYSLRGMILKAKELLHSVLKSYMDIDDQYFFLVLKDLSVTDQLEAINKILETIRSKKNVEFYLLEAAIVCLKLGHCNMASDLLDEVNRTMPSETEKGLIYKIFLINRMAVALYIGGRKEQAKAMFFSALALANAIQEKMDRMLGDTTVDKINKYKKLLSDEIQSDECREMIETEYLEMEAFELLIPTAILLEESAIAKDLLSKNVISPYCKGEYDETAFSNILILVADAIES